jgi:hypothetical protein
MIMAIDMDELRTNLRSFRTRSAAIDIMVGQKELGLEAAVKLLSDTNEGVRWAAITAMKRMGDKDAVAPLIDFMVCGRNTAAVEDTLCSLTGEDLGQDASAWTAWQAGGAVPTPRIGQNKMTDEEFLNEAVRGLPVEVEKHTAYYAIKVLLERERSQTVWVEFTGKDPDGEPIVQLSTACGKADPEKYEWVLKLNMRIPYGAVGLAKYGEEYCFAMVDAYQRSSVHPEDVAKSLVSLATQGDTVEQAVAGTDEH